MKNLIGGYSIVILMIFGLFGWSNPIEKDPNLILWDTCDLFQGDWFNTWDDPKDPRFIEQGIDVNKSFSDATYIREELYKIRQKYSERFKEMEGIKNSNYFQLTKDITKATKDFAAKYLDKAKPASINKNEIAFISFGSMARGESGIVTDLEGSLLWDPNVVGKDSLGLEFGQTLSNLLDGLIGHPIYGIRGFRLDEADHSPFHRAPWARTMSLADAYCMALKATPRAGLSKDENSFVKSYFYPFEGSWIYANPSPERLAAYVESGMIEGWPSMWSTKLTEKDMHTAWYQWAKPFLSSRLIQQDYIAKVLTDAPCTKEMDSSKINRVATEISLRLQANEVGTISNFPQLSRNRAFVYGNRDLFDQFERERTSILNADNQFLRKKLAIRYLNELVKYIGDPKIGVVTGKAPEAVDLKRINYRFEEQVHTNLAFLLDLEQQNQGDIIKLLTNTGKFGKDYGNRAWNRMNNIIRMRLKKQIVLQSQLGKNMQFLTKEAHNNRLQQMQDEIEKHEAIANDPKTSELDKLMAKNAIMEIKADLKLMPKLIPGDVDSISTPEDIAYIRNVLFPEQADVLKRLKAFIADNKDTSKPFNFDAFKD